MLKLKEGEYVGIIMDVVSELFIETSPIIRNTLDAAYRDALALIPHVNAEAEAHDDESDNGSIGCVDEGYAFVRGGNGIEWDYPCINAESRLAA